MAITLDGTTGITAPDIDVTAQSSDIVTSGDLTAAGIYLGGTGAANKLEDYETGTWTTSFSAATNLTGTPVLSEAIYVKIGDFVYLEGRVEGYSITSTSTLTYFVFTPPFTQYTNAVASTGTVKLIEDSTVGTINDASGGTTTTFFIAFKADTVTRTGATNFEFSLSYKAA